MSTDRVVGEEIALATGVGPGEVARRLSLATAPRRHRTILAALRAGTTSLHRALQVSSETAALSDADVALVEEAVLAPSRDGQAVPQRTFMTRLRRAIASVDSRGSEERRAQARSHRGVFGRLTGDGMGALTLVTGAEAIAAVLDRLDTQARAARGGGDGRTLDQLRCDLATEALLRNHLAAQQPAGASTERGCPDTGATGGGPSDGTSGAPAGDPTSSGPPGSTNGWVTAAHAREIISRPGSVCATLPVDVDTGQALSRPTKAYRPTRAMVEHVQAVDGVCRGPGCEVLAGRCDIDHEQPWPAGQTAVGNLFSKHRLHHNLKTDGIWTSHPSPSPPTATPPTAAWSGPRSPGGPTSPVRRTGARASTCASRATAVRGGRLRTDAARSPTGLVYSPRTADAAPSPTADAGPSLTTCPRSERQGSPPTT